MTDDGTLMLEINFGIISPEKILEVDIKLHMIPGLIETGLFTNADVPLIFF